MSCSLEEARKSVIGKVYERNIRRRIQRQYSYTWLEDQGRIQIAGHGVGKAQNIAKNLSASINKILKADEEANYGNHVYTYPKKDYFTEQVYVEIFTSLPYLQNERLKLEAARAVKETAVAPIDVEVKEPLSPSEAIERISENVFSFEGDIFSSYDDALAQYNEEYGTSFKPLDTVSRFVPKPEEEKSQLLIPFGQVAQALDSLSEIDQGEIEGFEEDMCEL